MDYILYPGSDVRTFKEGESFVGRIRHCLIQSPDLPTSKELEKLYQEFESDWESLDSLLMSFVD